MTRKTKTDLIFARIGVSIFIIYGMYKLTTVSPDIWKTVLIIGVIIPRYLWLLIIPVALLIIGFVIKTLTLMLSDN